MSRGSIIKREGKKGVSYLLKYDAERDPATGARVQRYKTCTGTKKEAQAELRRLMGEVDTGTAVDPSKMTVAEWIQTWLRDHAAPSVSQGTYEGYKGYLETHVVPKIGSVLIQKLTAPTIQKFLSDLLTSGRLPMGGTKATENGEDAPQARPGLSAQTVLHIHRALFSCLKAAARQKVIIRNPAEDVTAPNPKRVRAASDDPEDSGQIKALEQGELQTLFNGIRGTYFFALAVVAAGTGARRGELLALRWSDVDFEKKTLCISKALERTLKFGLRIKPPKNESSRRTIVIDDGLCRTLKAHRQYHEDLAASLGVLCPVDGLVFPCTIRRARGRQPLNTVVHDVDFTRPENPDAITKAFSRAATLAGLPDVHFHSLRHTHATQLLQGGVQPHVVAQRLGHSTPVITMTIYAHVLKRADDQASQVSGAMLSAALGASY
jgi:integrase